MHSGPFFRTHQFPKGSKTPSKTRVDHHFKSSTCAFGPSIYLITTWRCKTSQLTCILYLLQSHYLFVEAKSQFEGTAMRDETDVEVGLRCQLRTTFIIDYPSFTLPTSDLAVLTFSFFSWCLDHRQNEEVKIIQFVIPSVVGDWTTILSVLSVQSDLSMLNSFIDSSPTISRLLSIENNFTFLASVNTAINAWLAVPGATSLKTDRI
jgi:hypothetical protein